MKQKTFSHRVLSLALCLTLLLSLLPGVASAAPVGDTWDGSIATTFESGSGTAGDPYQITTGAQLAYLAKTVNDGNSYAGKYFILTDDIDLDNRQWTPIGRSLSESEQYLFQGSFDGGGYSITGLAVGTSGEPSLIGENGLFGYAGMGSTLKNLRVSGKVYGTSYCGILVGFHRGSILNCHATGTVSIGSHSGGLAGGNNGSITNCSANVTVSGDWNTGGLAGDNSGSITNCYAIGSVTGIATNDKGQIGGLVGWNYNGSIVNCYAVGAVTGGGSSYIGGFAGWNASSGTIAQDYYNSTDNPLNKIGMDSNNQSGNVEGMALTAMQTQAFADTLNSYAPASDAPLLSVWAWESGTNGGLPTLTGDYRATVEHKGTTTMYNSFQAASAYVGTLSDASIDSTTLVLGMDTVIDGGKENLSPGDMPAKPCTIDGGGHNLTAGAQDIYLNADTAMEDITVDIPGYCLDSRSYNLTLGTDFSASGDISGSSTDSKLQVNNSITCNALSHFKTVSLADDVTVTLAQGSFVYSIDTLDPGTGSAFAFSVANNSHGNFRYPSNGITPGKSIILTTAGTYEPKVGDKPVTIWLRGSIAPDPAAIKLQGGYANFALLLNNAGGPFDYYDYYVLTAPVDTVELSLSPNSIPYGDSTTPTAALKIGGNAASNRAGGTVTFYDGETRIGTATVEESGQTSPFTWTPPKAGAYSNLRAVYQDIGRAPAEGTASLTVNKKELTITAATVEDKVFNGKDYAYVTGVTFGGLVGSDSLIRNTDYWVNGTFVDQTAGENKNVTVAVTLYDTTAAENYVLPESPPSVSTTAKITQKPIVGTVGITVANGTGDASRIDEGDTLTADSSGITSTVFGYDILPSYQWYRGSEAISEATDSEYTVTAEDPSGTKLSVRVTASGNYSGTVQSAPVEVGKIPLNGWISIEGASFDSPMYKTDIVGKNLTLADVDPLTANAEYDIRWLRNGAPISGATGEIYTLVQEDLNREITVSLIGKGNYTGAVSAEAVSIPAVSPDNPVITLTPGDGQVAVNWAAPFDGGMPILNYKLHVYLEEDEREGEITGSPFALGSGARSYTVKGLTNGQSYWFKLWVNTEKGSVAYRQEAAPQAPAPAGGGGGGSASVNPPTSSTGGELPIDYRNENGTALLNLPEAKLAELIEAGKDGAATLDLSGTGAVTAAELPKAALASMANAGLGVSVKLPTGCITLDEAAAASVAGQAAGESLRISLAPVAANTLTAAQQEAINPGDLLLDISIRSDGRNISSFDGGRLQIQLPYSGPLPVAVWHLNDAGELEKIPCRFENGIVHFTLDHLPLYLLGQDTAWKNPFRDVEEGDWFYEAVAFVAQRGISTGTAENAFSPNASLTRGQFITLLMRAYAIAAEENPADNFADAGESYYTGYLAAAKRLGIAKGVGENRFAPESAVTRQEMFTLLYNALRSIDQLPIAAEGGKSLADFADGADAAEWAREALRVLLEAGIVSGSEGKLDPAGSSTRAQMAQLLYQLLRE